MQHASLFRERLRVATDRERERKKKEIPSLGWSKEKKRGASRWRIGQGGITLGIYSESHEKIRPLFIPSLNIIDSHWQTSENSNHPLLFASEKLSGYITLCSNCNRVKNPFGKNRGESILQ
jgi:hypothetical protein